MPRLSDFPISSLDSKIVFASANCTVKSFAKELISYILPDNNLIFQDGQYRLWKCVHPVDSVDLLLQSLKMQSITPKLYSNQSNNSLEFNCGVDFPGISIEEETETVSKFFDDSKIIVLEAATNDGKFIFKYMKNAPRGKCDHCKKHSILLAKCKCGKVFYFLTSLGHLLFRKM